MAGMGNAGLQLMNAHAMRTDEIVEEAVSEQERMGFLPSMLGGGMSLVLGEALIFGAMGELCSHYKGGSWDFVSLSNGSFYMWTRLDARVDGKVQVHSVNGSSESVTPKAAGIAASLFGLNRLCWRTKQERHCRVYEGLAAYARVHEESLAIGRLIN